MATSLIAKLVAAAQSYAPLQVYLGVGSAMRISSYPLPQGSTFPAIILQTISNVPAYAVNARLATGWYRVQATIFGLAPGGENARAVLSTWAAFLDQFSGDGIAGREIAPNRIVNVREFGIAQTAPLTFQIVCDAMIRNDETL